MSASAPAVNSVTLVGNLTADPILKQLDDDRQVCQLHLAINDQRDEPMFIDVATAPRSQAERQGELEERGVMWHRACADIERIRTQLRATGADQAACADAVREGAGVLSAWSLALEGHRPDALARAARQLARSAELSAHAREATARSRGLERVHGPSHTPLDSEAAKALGVREAIAPPPPTRPREPPMRRTRRGGCSSSRARDHDGSDDLLEVARGADAHWGLCGGALGGPPA